ncbi:MAG TPA: hypothetical protein DCE07_05560 [Peptococcaceae bacterium]|nr:hypothetical protein [Peptococcaceae bacterium]
MGVEKAWRLSEEGRKLLENEDFRGAEKKFAEALKYVDNVWLRNNLATAVFLAGDPSRALEVLEPVLKSEGDEDSAANPYTYALASMIQSSLGDGAQARQLLEQAIRDFDLEVSGARVGEIPHSFREYTVMIMMAAAHLHDHRLVLDLYRRWETYHISWKNKYLAGVASFNLRRFKKAAQLWASVADRFPMCRDMHQIALMVERGIIPGFEMSYNILSQKELKKMFAEAAESEEGRRKVVQNGFCRMVVLAYVLDNEDSRETCELLSSLIRYGGDWGESLGRSVLESSYFSRSMKLAAADALVSRGVFGEGEPIPAVVDGKRVCLAVKKTPVIEGRDRELDKLVDKAVKLRDQGKVAEAIDLLRGLLDEEKFYPRAMLTLANMLRKVGEQEEALTLFEVLEQIDPENPIILFNLSALMLEMGDLERAWEYYERIEKRDDLGKEFEEKLEILKERLELSELREDSLVSAERILEMYEESMREEVESKTLPVDPTIKRGLKNMPAQWLEGTCLGYGIEPERRRSQREEQILTFLSHRDNLERVVQGLSDDELSLLKYLIQRGGWSRLNAVTRKFGSMEGDGFFWREKKPKSPLGRLWLKALVMVGRSKLEGRYCKIATVPVELRQPLSELLSYSPFPPSP